MDVSTKKICGEMLRNTLAGKEGDNSSFYRHLKKNLGIGAVTSATMMAVMFGYDGFKGFIKHLF